jgi:hypothetical protein
VGKLSDGQEMGAGNSPSPLSLPLPTQKNSGKHSRIIRPQMRKFLVPNGLIRFLKVL